jgi:uncharacterized cupredoxin-like copper-binding protein
MDASAEAQYVTDVARGYELYLANCAECHGEEGQGGIGPRLNDQAKLYNVVTPAGNPGNGHLNPVYLDNVLTVGGRYVCGDPNSLMAAWKAPDGPLNYRQVEELILWMNASQDVVFEVHGDDHGEGDEEAGAPEVVAGWRDPNWEPGPEDTPVPACWKAPDGLAPAPASGGGTGAAVTGPTDGATGAPVAGGTPEEPRVVQLEATASLDFTDPDGTVVPEIAVVPGETIVFEIDNVADFDHNFWIGPESEVSVPSNETLVGHPTWQSGVQTVEWTVPPAEELAAGLQFACTVPGHYAAGMFGNFVIVEDGGEAAPAETDATAPAETETDATEPAAAGGTPEEPRVIQIEANSALQFLDENGAQLSQIDALPGETIEFVIDNTAGFEHNFYIGQADVLQGPYAETEVGIATWTDGVQTLTWTVPEAGAEGLQFACTVPGHYTPMHGDIVITAGAPAASGGGPAATEEAAETTDEAAAEPPGDDAAGETAAGGTPENPRVIKLQANAALQFLDENGAQLTSIDAVPGETIEFQIDNTAGFEHNFFIGSAEDLQVPYGETEAGIATWTSGVETYTWTVPESGAEGLQFACTVPGHYTPMHGDIVISS